MTLPIQPDAVGYLAAILTTSSFVPQAVLTLRTRDVSGISLSMYGAFTLGVALWLLYGIAIGEWPVIIANVVTLALATTILVTKVRVERARTRSTSKAGGGGAAAGEPRA
ncbi:MAG: SemiSWEET family sugar transporter [Pelomonas sp.]|nr:SemiSWEET family sugar transporter [Roseateles sp.]